MVKKSSVIVLLLIGLLLFKYFLNSCNYGYKLRYIPNPDSLKFVYWNGGEANPLFLDVEIVYDGRELSFSKVDKSESYDNEKVPISVDDSISQPMIQLIKSLFVNSDTPIYEYWTHSEEKRYHEGNILDVYSFKGKHSFQSRLLIQGAYNQEPQLSEDGHEYMYTPEFKMFVQYLNYISAIIANVNREKKEWYIEEMYDCYNNSKYQVYYPSKDWIESQRLELGDSQNLENFGLLLPKDLAE